MKKPCLLAALAAVLIAPMAPAWAQAAYPTKPIKIVVPFPAGGTSDVLARIFGQKITESWGQAVVVDNRPGSSGNLGADLVAKSPADGHTLVLMDVGNLVISPALFKLPFNVEKDFAPVAMVAYSTHLRAVSTQVPANTPAELVAPAGTPKAVVDKLHAEVQRIAALPEIKERLTALGAEPSGMTPDQFGQWMRSEIPAMAKIVKDEKITVE
ncbi:Bug family tripartite tricarboxylate transporter substrate binding protein [Limnohabitans sp. DCL3]|uniref:Bug family tripartite tricarboxylate transporter substrate binding protein n=1 Tax=Limnohabitans sp. DCL3 TaxID=3374103 RepID=UPI003A88F353